MSIKDNIKNKLTERLAPLTLEIIDDSGRHAGHGGAHPEGESHFSIKIVSPQFVGKSRVDRQRLVYGILAEELSGRVHALALSTLAPGEDGAG